MPGESVGSADASASGRTQCCRLCAAAFSVLVFALWAIALGEGISGELHRCLAPEGSRILPMTFSGEQPPLQALWESETLVCLWLLR